MAAVPFSLLSLLIPVLIVCGFLLVQPLFECTSDDACLRRDATRLNEFTRDVASLRRDATTPTPSSDFPRNSHTYVVCNGFSNQLLSHSGNIAFAVASELSVSIPDAYITNGEQNMRSDGRLLAVTPSLANHTKLSSIFDVAHLLHVVESFGIRARLVPYTEQMHGHLTCDWIKMVARSDPQVVQKVLDAFVPNSYLQVVVDDVRDALPEQTSCLHHRDGPDWHAHCAEWEAIPDGIWRHNCLMDGGGALVDEIWNRVSLVSSADVARRPSLYYVGDHEPPPSLTQVFQVNTHSQVVPELAGRQRAAQHLADGVDLLSLLSSATCPTAFRDVCAAVDFFVCSSMSQFVGNSVSTWSALQIARRNAMATWYNSRSIPLANFLRSYSVPVVYTYTEMSSPAGRFMLMSSITSCWTHLPDSHIHILYHGNEDGIFRSWLVRRGVTVHDHRPVWMESIKDMFESGDPRPSHSFGTWGNFLGTWQRIDIPLFLQTEYVLYMDCDTVVASPFSLADFGAKLTKSIAFSSEWDEHAGPADAGVALLNLPYLRRTHRDFVTFIEGHRYDSMFTIQRDGNEIRCPNNWGAFLEFYNTSVELLAKNFDAKSYSRGTKDVKIFHFHGAKPHDFFGHLLGKNCHPAFEFMCLDFKSQPMTCKALREFAVHLHQAKVLTEYCHAVFEEKKEGEACMEYFTAAATEVSGSWRDRCKRNVPARTV